MKTHKIIFISICSILLFNSLRLIGQSVDSVGIDKEFTQVEEAVKVPERVYRLNLSNQSFKKFPEGLSKFINLQYLSLRNDYLKEVPLEVTELKNLRVLDLGGNDLTLIIYLLQCLRYQNSIT